MSFESPFFLNKFCAGFFFHFVDCVAVWTDELLCEFATRFWAEFFQKKKKTMKNWPQFSICYLDVIYNERFSRICRSSESQQTHVRIKGRWSDISRLHDQWQHFTFRSSSPFSLPPSQNTHVCVWVYYRVIAGLASPYWIIGWPMAPKKK